MPTITLNTHDLPGPALNWAMAIAEGIPPERLTFWANTRAVVRRCDNGLAQRMDFDTNANQMNEIIEREQIATVPTGDANKWQAYIWDETKQDFDSWRFGSTALIAAARCWVARKLGPTVQVPCELVPAPSTPPVRVDPLPRSASECEFGDEEYQFRLHQAGL